MCACLVDGLRADVQDLPDVRLRQVQEYEALPVALQAAQRAPHRIPLHLHQPHPLFDTMHALTMKPREVARELLIVQ